MDKQRFIWAHMDYKRLTLLTGFNYMSAFVTDTWIVSLCVGTDGAVEQYSLIFI